MALIIPSLSALSAFGRLSVNTLAPLFDSCFTSLCLCSSACFLVSCVKNRTSESLTASATARSAEPGPFSVRAEAEELICRPICAARCAAGELEDLVMLLRLDRCRVATLAEAEARVADVEAGMQVQGTRRAARQARRASITLRAGKEVDRKLGRSIRKVQRNINELCFTFAAVCYYPWSLSHLPIVFASGHFSLLRLSRGVAWTICSSELGITHTL